MPTQKEIEAGAAAIRQRYEDTRVKLVKEPSRDELARVVLEAAEKVRTVPLAKLDEVGEAQGAAPVQLYGQTQPGLPEQTENARSPSFPAIAGLHNAKRPAPA